MSKGEFIKSKGFTIIELMIAISILSLLLFTGSYSYSLMSERWNKELGQFSQSAQNAKQLENFQRLIEGIQSFIVVDNNQSPSFFFVGDNNSLLAVSRSGLFSGEFSEIFRLTTVIKENGKLDLVYQSSSTEQVLLVGTEQNIEFTQELTLFSDLDDVSFSYLGWSHLHQKNALQKNPANHRWFERFSGIDSQLMPEQVSITLTKSAKELSFSVYLDSSTEKWMSPYIKWDG